MRSYYAHLETAANASKKNLTSKPTFRSSAIFPVFHLPGISTRILFMGYWLLKRNISQVACVATLRDIKGEVLYRENQLIAEPKTYAIEADKLLKEIHFSEGTPFFGSLEVEFFSTVNLVFPYPAVTVNYYGPHFSSAVHTAQRVYNDFEDMKNNSQTHVAESGFNIHLSEQCEPFIALINGPQMTANSKISLEFLNLKKESVVHEVQLGDLAPYQTSVIYPAQLFDLKDFLQDEVGTVKANFNLPWIFPRLLVGNILHSLPAMNITHSYYDCSAATSPSDYWLSAKPGWHPAALMLPCYVHDDYFTNIYFYPIYSPTLFAIDVEFFDHQGQKLGTLHDAIDFHATKQEFKLLDLKKICKDLGITTDQPLAIRLIARGNDGQPIPARIKVALDIGHQKLEEMACNICTNLQPFNPALETKPSTFKWSPLLADQAGASLWVMNSSPEVTVAKTSEIKLSFYRENDIESLARTYTLPPQGFLLISPDRDNELKDFFEGSVGWCTIVATNPYTTAYFFSNNRSGFIGGDHCF